MPGMTNSPGSVQGKGNHFRTAVSGTFGLAVIGSGLWRFFSADGGHAGLWFGIVMGGLALVSAWLSWLGRTRTAAVLIGLCLVFVGGWFTYESFVKKGLAEAEPRQLMIIVLTILTTIALLLQTARSNPSEPG